MNPRTRSSRAPKPSCLRITALIALEFPIAVAVTSGAFIAYYGVPARSLGNDSTLAATPFWAEPTTGGLVYDDVGRTCAETDLQVIELRVKTDGTRYLGHTFLHTPNMTIGFQTDEPGVSFVDYLNPLARPMPGVICDDSGFPYDHALPYRASPETIRILEESIRDHGDDPYQLGNWSGGRNCTTWARDRLVDAGLTPPSGGCPNRMARHMNLARPTD